MIYVLSGGGSKGAQKKATIVVSYPSGATCTVSKDSKSYEALDTSGSAAFVVDAGTWTVQIAQSGQTTKTKSVTVAAGKYAEVELYFELSLFGNGVDNTSVTGGMMVFGGNSTPVSLTTVDNQLVYTQSPHSFGESCPSYVGPTNKIDLTDYSVFRVSITSASTSSSGVIGVGSERTYQGINGSGCSTTANAVGTFDLDISSQVGEFYIGWGMYTGSGNYTFKFSEFKLIP